MSSLAALTELEDLALFMQEKMQEVDPSVDTTPGSPFYSGVIQPLLDRLGPDPYLTPIRDFIVSKLQSELPDTVVADGEPLDDLVAKPMQILMAPLRRQIQNVSLQQSFANSASLNSREADNLGANFFVRRVRGASSIGVARLYFNAPQYVLVAPSNPVSTGAGLRFFPVENQSITADSMIFNTEGSLFYFDIVVRAETEGESYNIPANTLTGIEGLPAVVRVVNKLAFEEGLATQTTEEYIQSIEDGLTERSLVTLRGLNARLKDVFEQIKLLQVIGFGDPEMDRDILRAAVDIPEPYAYALVDSTTPGTTVSLAAAGTPPRILPSLGTAIDSFVTAGVRVGDYVLYADVATGLFSRHTVTSVTVLALEVTPDLPSGLTTVQVGIARDVASLTISDIPGGILLPNTPFGELVIRNDEVHIGGVFDVFIRAGAPQEQSVTIEGVRDGSPLRFGVDLESFGADSTRFLHVTENVDEQAAIPSTDRFGVAVTDHILIRQYDDSGDPVVPWKPTEDDVGRYIQLLDAVNGNWGTLKIEEVLDEEYFEDGSAALHRMVRIRVELIDQETGGAVTLTPTADVEVPFRLAEQASITDLVRDRDGSRAPVAGFPTILAGVDFSAEGAEIGDSVVIETGDDAGIYSIRRILSSLASNDTLVLDRDLTREVTPAGDGAATGLRYRVADDLNLDLIEPRVQKIPLGDVFAAGDLNTVAGSRSVNVGGTTNFLLAGVEAGDTLEILDGGAVGKYKFVTVAGTTATLDAEAPATSFLVDFLVYREFQGVTRPMVRVKSIEILDSNAQPTGITVPYGDIVDARILGTLSNRAEGETVESFTGDIQSTVLLEDTSTDFVALGIQAGFRLNVLNTDNQGEYVIAKVGTPDGLGSDNQIEVETAANGGTEFPKVTSPVHYSIGFPSAGIARLYFLEPTSVVVTTGLAGGRLETIEDTPRQFMFSAQNGYQLYPPAGEATPRNLRVARSYEVSPSVFNTALELTGVAEPDAFDLELQVGDIVEVNEHIPFREVGGQTFPEIGVFGAPAGLRTLAGSNRVSVPATSLINFTAMNSATPLVGQKLIIEEGPDAGEYIIEAVESSKALRLNRTMIGTTETILGAENTTPRDGTLATSGSATNLTDLTDGPSLGTVVGHFITIFESTRADLDGTYEVTSIVTPGSVIEIDASFTSPAASGTPIDAFSTGLFGWVRTSSDLNVGHAFNIYQEVPTKVEVLEVATKRANLVGVRGGAISSTTQLDDTGTNFVTAGVARGDLVEILRGPSAGIYAINTVNPTSLVIATNLTHYFPATESSVPYRVWGGVHGARKMITVGPFESSDGRVDPGPELPFVILRQSQFRASSTEMEASYDGTLYYVDIPIESLGAGDSLNLEKDTRLRVTSGLLADGYTYSVDNPTLTFSPRERVSLTFDRRFLPVGNSDSPENYTEINGRSLQITYESSSTVRLVDNLLRSEADRPVNANPLARHFLPSYVLTTFRYRGGASVSSVGPELESYINTLGATDELEVSDLEAFLTRRGATSIQHPIELVTVTHDLQRHLVVNRSDNRLGGTSDVPYDGTGRLSAFFATLGEGLNLEKLS
jgi:bifunctional DNA-binding transcriptional regulator/antitoxin component of YhaV-PrlF toxin-antitoxin module